MTGKGVMCYEWDTVSTGSTGIDIDALLKCSQH